MGERERKVLDGETGRGNWEEKIHNLESRV